MTSIQTGTERRLGQDRRMANRRLGDRFAADAWRYSGQPDRRSGHDRRDGEDRRVEIAGPPVKLLPLPEAAARVVEEGRLRVVYQPIYQLKTGKVFAYEALARVDAPEFDSLLDLFRAASEAGLVGELGHLHRTQAMTHCPHEPLFINIFPTEFDYGLLVRPDDALFRHKHPVYIEITESIPLSHFDQCHDVIQELRKKGIGLAIDDLGAGFSNLKYIADLAPEIVKLDRGLISGVREGNRQAKLIRLMVSLCKDMGAQVVAEGIETIQELIVAERAGVDFCQGFLLGRPGPSPNGDPWPAFH
jgi:EAL domain-containing protein (putative c-di-GMP-specific phosphodiesterase class I)